MDIFLISWLWSNQQLVTSHSGPKWSRAYVLVGSMQLTSSTWWRFRYLQNSSKDMAQNIICSPWRGTKGPWLCLMAKLLFCLTDFFSFCIFSVLWLHLLFRTWECLGGSSFSANKRQVEDMRACVLERPQKVLLSYNCSFTWFLNELNEIMP